MLMLIKAYWAEGILVFGTVITILGTLAVNWKQGQEQLRHKQEIIGEHVKNTYQIINEHRNLITGGDSIVFFRPAKSADTDEVLLTTAFRGKYPVYDVSVTVEEFDLVQTGKNAFKYQKVGTRTHQLGTMHPLSANHEFMKVRLPAGDKSQFGKHFFFRISARNGVIEQDVHVRKEGPHYSQAVKVVMYIPEYASAHDIANGTIRRRIKKIDAGFPLRELQYHWNGDSGWEANYEESL